jgi:signal transduction histidine kinase
MYRRLLIISIVIFVSLCGLCALGYYSITLQEQGLQGKRAAEFVTVAEQIRRDVKAQFDTFLQTEQARPYTDYQYYYVPQNQDSRQMQQQVAVVRSPLGENLEHGLAYGHFQIEPDGAIITPFLEPQETQKQTTQKIQSSAQTYLTNVRNNLLPTLKSGLQPVVGRVAGDALSYGIKTSSVEGKTSDSEYDTAKKDVSYFLSDAQRQPEKAAKSKRAAQLKIDTLDKSQQTQVITQSRSEVASNIANTRGISSERRNANAPLQSMPAAQPGMGGMGMPGMQPPVAKRSVESNVVADKKLNESREEEKLAAAQEERANVKDRVLAKEMPQQVTAESQPQSPRQQEDVVQIRIEPFVPVTAPAAAGQSPPLGRQVFLMRHVQIESRHFMQGFMLNQQKLLQEVRDSASRLVREGMGFDLGLSDKPNIAYTAVLDFGFGDVVLNLIENDPLHIAKQITFMRNWYFGIVALVVVVVAVGMGSLWRNVRAQLKLAQKKDDFISAVSHELRTPLASIRMYAEMLEKNWVKSDEKRGEYYSNMRQESERLSRLIENVLDFARIQKGRKKYDFRAGDINKCIDDTVKLMEPYAQQANFTIQKDFAQVPGTAFDNDAVVQIVVNLIDNAIKYARNAEDKKIIVRTRSSDGFIVIEVEDHGPGVPHRQREKIFDEFYRIEAEATRETAGTGLGLALVKKFAQAHKGFVEVLSAKPTGVVFRVALAARA